MQAVGAIIPHPIINQAAARIPALVRRGIGLIDALVNDLELERIIPDDLGMAGRGICSA
jgi:hypothetical protein